MALFKKLIRLFLNEYLENSNQLEKSSVEFPKVYANATRIVFFIVIIIANIAFASLFITIKLLINEINHWLLLSGITSLGQLIIVWIVLMLFTTIAYSLKYKKLLSLGDFFVAGVSYIASFGGIRITIRAIVSEDLQNALGFDILFLILSSCAAILLALDRLINIFLLNDEQQESTEED